MSIPSDQKSTKPPDLHTCAEPSRGTMWSRYPCGKRASFFEEKWGQKQWFCGTHAPSERSRRSDARNEARLIADAPRLEVERRDRQLRNAASEMLAALKFVQQYFKRSDASGNFLGDEEHETWKIVSEAIAKAEDR